MCIHVHATHTHTHVQSRHKSVIPVCPYWGTGCTDRRTAGYSSFSLVYTAMNSKRLCFKEGGRQGGTPEAVLSPLPVCYNTPECACAHTHTRAHISTTRAQKSWLQKGSLADQDGRFVNIPICFVSWLFYELMVSNSACNRMPYFKCVFFL